MESGERPPPPPPTLITPTPTKRIQKSYTISEKLAAIQQVKELNGNLSATSRKLGIDRKRLREWCHRENELMMIEDKNRRRFSGPTCCRVTSGNSDAVLLQSMNYGSGSNGVANTNDQATYGHDSSDPIYVDSQDVPNHLNNLQSSTDLAYLQQQQIQSSQSKHQNLSIKSSPSQSPIQHPPKNSMIFPNLPRGMYITRNPEELSETDRTRDSGVISTDDCDNLDSKEAIAAQIEMMQSSQYVNNDLTETSQSAIGDNSKIGEDFSDLNMLAASSENKADCETDSIAEYFKICDSDTRQTFLDVMRNDREQHLTALDKINTDLKSVTLELQQTKTEHCLKEQQLQEVMKQVTQLQMDMLNLQSRCTELSEQEKILQRKLKTYTKKVSLCDSALNSMNER